jgi:hypothetical protein
MTPKLLLRIAAILIFIHATLHTVGTLSWKQAPDPVEQQVIHGMTGHQFPFMGATHSLGDYYQGFIYFGSIALFLFAVLLWMLSGELASGNRLAKNITLALSYALLIWAADEWIYFFPFAAGITFAACLCTRWSVYLVKRQKAIEI